jgi:UDP-glucose:(glucosyl)LPS alpha-1,2-glucosyltransferase
MSCVYKGSVVDTDLSRNAMGGTEMMRGRLIQAVPASLLENFAIHFSRPRAIYPDVKNIFFAHDLATDPENKILLNDGWKNFDMFVFVSYWQRDQYVTMFGIPFSKCTVIENAIEVEPQMFDKENDRIRFVYHTTPHRGLEILYHVFDELSKRFDNIHLDVFSSFKVYGWEERDKRYEPLFDSLKKHPRITYHGAKDNAVVIDALKKSHIFAYPSIWQETSCIAMIEALHCGCMVIHPNLGALHETSSDVSIMYDYTEDVRKHAARFYNVVSNVLMTEKMKPGFIQNHASESISVLKFSSKYSINTFQRKWNELLKGLTR